MNCTLQQKTPDSTDVFQEHADVVDNIICSHSFYEVCSDLAKAVYAMDWESEHPKNRCCHPSSS